MPASANATANSGGNRACVITASMAVTAAARSAFAQAISVPSRRYDVVDQQNRPAGEQGRFGKSDFDRAVAAPGFLRHRGCQSEPACEISDPRAGFRVRSDHDGRRINPARLQRFGDGRHRRQVVGLDAREHRLDVSGAMQMSIDRDDAVDIGCEQPADRPLADRLALVEGGVLRM